MATLGPTVSISVESLPVIDINNRYRYGILKMNGDSKLHSYIYIWYNISVHDFIGDNLLQEGLDGGGGRGLVFTIH